jgi:hypothetical protein
MEKKVLAYIVNPSLSERRGKGIGGKARIPVMEQTVR